MANSDAASATHRFLSVLDLIPGYRRDWLLPDVIAGLALWAVMVPEGMAYAGIVGVPPIMGLYTIVPALLAYALLGTSRQLVVGPDTATGLISAVTIGAIATQGTAEFNSLTSTLAVLIGFFFLVFGMRMVVSAAHRALSHEALACLAASARCLCRACGDWHPVARRYAVVSPFGARRAGRARCHGDSHVRRRVARRRGDGCTWLAISHRFCRT